MTRRYVHDSEIDARIAEIETHAYTPQDEAAIISRDEDRYADFVYGETFRDWYGERASR